VNALVYWAGGAVLVAGLGLVLLRLPGRRALAMLLLLAAAGLAAARQFALAIPLAMAAMALWRDRPSASRGQPSRGQVSEVSTGWFEMSLDHDTGEIDGAVRRGDHAGRRLSSLSTDDIRALWAAINADADAESLSLLEAYVARHRPDAAREEASAGGTTARRGGEMTEEDACRILGLEPGASREEVRAAYHRLIRKVHPDRGGTSELAALINAARRRLDPG
jgi:DnaJ-domain-containing protein 1